jgi:hypothetical protein
VVVTGTELLSFPAAGTDAFEADERGATAGGVFTGAGGFARVSDGIEGLPTGGLLLFGDEG